MKRIYWSLLTVVLAGLQAHAQDGTPADGIKKSQLPVVYLPENISVHFISPEPIQYVDISTKMIAGDLPLKNVLRIRLNTDSVTKRPDWGDAVVTVAGEKFIAQYHIIPADPVTTHDAVSEIEILPTATRSLDISGIGLSHNQLKEIALGLASKDTRHPVTSDKAFGIAGSVNHIYTYGDYLFIDLGYRNKTNLAYNIDEFRFKMDDKKVTKASNVQSLEIRPELVLFNLEGFKRDYRNVFVFRKMSFPGNKVLHIELSEKQLSGRTLSLAVRYQDLLDADQASFND